jgi:sugar/nucleoside kinase (ribokinase family)
MTSNALDVVTIGNAIVDIIGRCDDAYLTRHGCAKGSMRIVDEATLNTLYAGMGPGIEISGGSAANTAAGVASFGGRAAFIGKIADDDFGRVFAHDIKAVGVRFENAPVSRRNGASGTSRSLILVTPDGERTMNTLLGISTEFTEADIRADVIQAAKITYLEGYLFDRPEAKAAFRRAASLAKAAGRKVALSLSDAFCVDRHRDEFLSFIAADVDLLFANESEITSLYQVREFDDAARRLGKVPVAILTRSAKGSVVIAAGKEPIHVPVSPVPRVIDTTGAGDLYAAGFLYGFTQGRDLAVCGRLASLAAAEIISHVGARPEAGLADLARAKGL